MSIKYLGYFLVILLVFSLHPLQTNAQTILSKDVSNFWIAYDKIHKSNSYDDQLHIIKSNYLNLGTYGLKEFCRVMKYTDSAYVNAILRYPKFWNSLWAKTQSLEANKNKIKKHLKNFKRLYPHSQPANLYLCIGLGNSGGKPLNKDLVIGLELALADSTINTSEYQSQRKKDYYRNSESGGIEFVAVHEYVHTQQKSLVNNNVLKNSIYEGACDFIAELVIGKPIDLKYIQYGYQNYSNVLELFRQDLLSTNFDDWFHNHNVSTIKDLGYFIGYDICKNYYNNSVNKKVAIKEIIELDYSDDESVLRFLNVSGIFKAKIEDR
ncbi:hypothetical protein [Sphingobacterium cavernae]|uniref:hypothetical protein n=1 Tax=Sphingobacterium cavernae TaxID=2592657 RepID=UPI00122FDB3E|nr:hypothetical protein [Sphingobacterium cavernae]